MSEAAVGHGSLAEWAKGWKMVVAASAGMSLSPILTYTMGIFIIPIEKEFGWDRALITSGLTVNAVLAVLLSPAVGALIDRIGPRRIAIPGVLCFCIFLAALASVGNSIWFWWALWLGIAVGSLMVKPTVWAKAIVGRFDKSRGLALALMLSGSGLTGIFSPLLAGYLLEHYGWRTAYVGLALVYLVVVMPLVVAFFHGATDSGAKPVQKGPAAPAPHDLPGMKVKEALSTATFWKLAAAVLFATTVVTGGLVHFVPAVIDDGIDRTIALGLASTIGIFAVVGRMCTGFLLDRFNARIVGSVAFLLPALSFTVLAALEGNAQAALFSAIFLGLASGAEFEIATYLTSRYFGMRNFGTLFGIIVGFAGLASGLGAPLAGFSFDRLGSYDFATWAAIGLGTMSCLLIATLPGFAKLSPVFQSSESPARAVRQ